MVNVLYLAIKTEMLFSHFASGEVLPNVIKFSHTAQAKIIYPQIERIHTDMKILVHLWLKALILMTLSDKFGLLACLIGRTRWF